MPGREVGEGRRPGGGIGVGRSRFLFGVGIRVGEPAPGERVRVDLRAALDGASSSGLFARRAFWAPPRFRSVTKETADATRASAASNDLTPDDVAADVDADVADGVEVDVEVDVGVDVDVDVDAAAAAASVSRRFAFDGLRLGFVGDHGLRTFAFRLGSA